MKDEIGQLSEFETAMVKLMRSQPIETELSEPLKEARHLAPKLFGAGFNKGMCVVAKEDRDWMQDALALIADGIDIMTTAQVGRWSGLGKVISSCPVDKEDG